MKSKHVIVMALAGATALFGVIAVSKAGLKVDSEVSVNTTSRFLSGALGSGRNSADSTQYMTIGMDDDSIYCYAKNAAGTAGSCSATAANTEYAEMREVIGSANGDSYVTCQYNSSGVCTHIGVYQSSRYAPKGL